MSKKLTAKRANVALVEKAGRLDGLAPTTWRGLRNRAVLALVAYGISVDNVIELRIEDYQQMAGAGWVRVRTNGKERTVFIPQELRPVRRQGFRDNRLGKLREALAHRHGEVRRPAAGAASGE